MNFSFWKSWKSILSAARHSKKNLSFWMCKWYIHAWYTYNIRISNFIIIIFLYFSWPSSNKPYLKIISKNNFKFLVIKFLEINTFHLDLVTKMFFLKFFLWNGNNSHVVFTYSIFIVKSNINAQNYKTYMCAHCYLVPHTYFVGL